MAKDKNKSNLQSLLSNVNVGNGPQLTQVDPGTSQYDRAGVIDLNENRANEQGAWDATKNITGRFVGRASLGLAEAAGMFTWGIGKATATGKFSDFYNNEVTQYLDGVNKTLQEATPFYSTQAEKDSCDCQNCGKAQN
jgi:hypothetical protein